MTRVYQPIQANKIDFTLEIPHSEHIPTGGIIIGTYFEEDSSGRLLKIHNYTVVGSKTVDYVITPKDKTQQQAQL